MTLADLHEQFRAQAEQVDLDCEVLSSGPINAQVAVIGEGPGETEVRKGEPFVGGSGALLWNSLRKYGLHRINTYATNVVKRQISLSKVGNEKHAVLRSELERWIGLLKFELEQLPNLKVVFAMGNYAIEALTGNTGVLNWRGSVVDVELGRRKIKVVCTLNPAYALRELKMEPMFWMDCDRLNRVVTGKFKPHVVEALINPTLKEALAFIKDLQKVDRPVSLDVEHIKETYCYGLSNDPNKAMCINFRDHLRNRFTLSEDIQLLNAIQGLCDSHKIIVQNANHEISWCRMHDLVSMEPWMDTLLGHHLLYPQWPHSLQFITAQYTSHPFYKDEGSSWREGGDINTFWIYNCKDAALTYAAHIPILKELEKRKLTDLFFGHVMRGTAWLGSSTVHGMAVDHDIRNLLIEQIGEDVERLKAEFHRLVIEATDDPDYTPNPGSWPQMKELYFDRLKLKGRGTSTDKTNRDYMLKDVRNSPISKEILIAIDKWSSEAKFLNTFAMAQLGDDERMRCSWKQHGTTNAPGRLSSAQLIDGQGMNMQNQPHRARAMYVADPGTVLIYFDLKQAEAQVVGFRYRIEAWKAQYAQAAIDGKYDAHCALASEMFRVPYDEVPRSDFLDENGRSEKDPLCNHGTLKPTIRYIAKRCRHGLNYRMQRQRLAETTKLPFHEAARAYSLYHRITPELQKGWKQDELMFRKHRVLINAYGRELKVIQRLDDDVMDSIIAFYPQSTIGDKVYQVWYQSMEDDKWPAGHARIAINVHDNLVGITEPKYAKTCLAIVKKYAESPIMIQDAWGGPPTPLSIPAELKMSYPTAFKWDAKQRQLTFHEDPKGLHRWSHMKDVVL